MWPVLGQTVAWLAAADGRGVIPWNHPTPHAT